MSNVYVTEIAPSRKTPLPDHQNQSKRPVIAVVTDNTGEVILEFSTPNQAIEFIHKIEDAAEKTWGTRIWQNALKEDRNNYDISRFLEPDDRSRE